jgi:peptidoglycan/LPS O-acetylase OafA/YrhL
MTLADRLTVTKGRPSGFDYMRLLLALSVIAWHSLLISYGTDEGPWRPVLGPLALLIVPMFFALSGFLVDHGKDSCVILTHRRRSAEAAHWAAVTPDGAVH